MIIGQTGPAEAGTTNCTREEAEQLAEEVVRLQVELDRLTAARDAAASAALEPIRKEYEPKIKAAGEVALAKSQAVQKWVEENRREVLPGEQRSFETAIAKVGFRWSPPRLETTAGLTWDDVLRKLKLLKRRFVELRDGTKVSFVTRFVRVKEETNRDQLKKDILGDLVDDKSRRELGVVVKQDEVFFISGR